MLFEYGKNTTLEFNIFCPFWSHKTHNHPVRAKLGPPSFPPCIWSVEPILFPTGNPSAYTICGLIINRVIVINNPISILYTLLFLIISPHKCNYCNCHPAPPLPWSNPDVSNPEPPKYSIPHLAAAASGLIPCASPCEPSLNVP